MTVCTHGNKRFIARTRGDSGDLERFQGIHRRENDEYCQLSCG
jgi:hypothetical protein